MDGSDVRSNEDLVNVTSKGKRAKFLFFWGHTVEPNGAVGKTCFSQWYPAAFEIGGIRYATAEHYMMAEKARLFDDVESLKQILQSRHPKQAKQFGRGVHNFDDSKWNENRFKIVIAGNLEKFRQNERLRDFLVGTGKRVLVEASPVDKIWGIGMAQDHPAIESPDKWRGLNLLGYALMEVRSLLQK